MWLQNHSQFFMRTTSGGGVAICMLKAMGGEGCWGFHPVFCTSCVHLRLPCESSLGEIGDRALEMILVPYGILSLGCMLDPRMETYPLGSWHLYESQHSYSTCWWSLPCCTLLALGTCSNATVILPPGIPHRLPLPVCSAALLHNVFVPP